MAEENTRSPDLKLIKVDLDRLQVSIRCDTDDLQDQIDQLQSEDAKVFAVRSAVEAGLPGAMLRNVTLCYGDSKTGKVTRNLQPGNNEPMEPFLVVDVHSDQLESMRYLGDSNAPARNV